jgi:hypothetical protein
LGLLCACALSIHKRKNTAAIRFIDIVLVFLPSSLNERVKVVLCVARRGGTSRG